MRSSTLGLLLRGGTTRQIAWTPDPHPSQLHMTSDAAAAEVDRLMNEHSYDRLRQRGLLTALEVADRFGVSDDTVHRWQRAGRLRAHAYSDRPRYLYEIPDSPPTEQPGPRPKQGPFPDPAGQWSSGVQYGT